MHVPKSVDLLRFAKDVSDALSKRPEHLKIKKYISHYVKAKKNRNLDKNVRTRNVFMSGTQINGQR